MCAAYTFCPTCANLLQVQNINGENLFVCDTCPYIYSIDKKITKGVALKRKEVEDVFGGEKAWENVARTAATCEACGHQEAYFKEFQTRSADEPATLFYRCVKCKQYWKEG